MSKQRRGFTLVELLVVIAIIGILVALLLPAIQAARESARRNQCINNLRQLSIATQNYVDARKSFPPGKIVTAGSDFTCWSLELLPYLEEATLYKKYDFKKTNIDPVNAIVTQTILNVMNCPSDDNAGKLAMPEADPAGREWATGSYRAVTGKGYALAGPGESFFDSRKLKFGTLKVSDRGILTVIPDSSYTTNTDLNQLKVAKMRNVVDGTSKTMLVGEYSAHTKIERTVYWGKSWFAMNMGSIMMDAGPAVLIPDYEYCLANTPIGSTAPSACKRTISSLHGGGSLIQYTFADGSTRSISNEIELRILGGLATMAGGELTESP